MLESTVALPALSLQSRQDLIDWAYSLLPDPYACPREVGATYTADIRELEWASRPLWAVFALIAGGEDPADPRLTPFIERMRAGLTPGHELAFPEPTKPGRQVVLEQAVYGYGLLCLGNQLLDLLTREQQERLVTWLNASNGIELPWGSWYAARILTNCALAHCGLEHDPATLAADCAAFESMYDGDGWYEDGTPFKRDLYTASAYHFTALLLEHYLDEGPLKDALARANAFDADFAYWFDRRGRCIPFGRSLTYRFVNAAFWSALALTEKGAGARPEVSGECPKAREERSETCVARPLSQVKGLMLNHLSWWHDCLDGQERCMRPGYGYPGAPVLEDYAGPGISYWGFRAFVVLALPESDPFWSVEPVLPALRPRRAERQPGMLIQTGERHSYALSAMQYLGTSVLQRASKYGKMCYSTAFGWNASLDAAQLSGFALDSALALSVAGTGQFASRTRIQDHELTGAYAYSVWSYGTIAQVETWLVPVDEFRHVRVHRVQSLYPLEAYEGGFPLHGWQRKFDIAEEHEGAITLRRASDVEQGRDSMVCGISDMFAARAEIEDALHSAGLRRLVNECGDLWTAREALAVSQAPNANIYSCEPSGVPALKLKAPAESFCLACMVYGDPGCEK